MSLPNPPDTDRGLYDTPSLESPEEFNEQAPGLQRESLETSDLPHSAQPAHTAGLVESRAQLDKILQSDVSQMETVPCRLLTGSRSESRPS